MKYHFKPITPCTTVYASLHDWIKTVTNHLRPLCKSHSSHALFCSLPLPSHLNSKGWLTLTQIIILLKMKKRAARQWIHFNNYANQTGDEAFINVREVLHQILQKFIKLLLLKMNTFWLVSRHCGLYHIIFLGCVSAKLPMDLLLQ